MASRRLLLLLPGLVAGIAVTASCGGNGVSPNITGLDRMSASFQETGISVRIDGSGFAQRVVPDTADPSRSTMQNPTVEFGGVAVLSSYLGPNAIQVNFSGSGEGIPYGSILVKVTNPDGSSDTFDSFNLIGPAARVRFEGGMEPNPGTSNAVGVTYRLLDEFGNETSAGGPLSFTVLLSATSATATPALVDVLALATGGTFTVNWTRVGDVEVYTNDLVTTTAGRATFRAGPPARLAVFPGQTVVFAAAPTTIDSGIQVQDADGNPVASDQALSLSWSAPGSATCGNACPSYTGPTDPLSIAQGASNGTFTIGCSAAPAVGSPFCAHVRVIPGTQPVGWLTTGGVFFWEAP